MYISCRNACNRETFHLLAKSCKKSPTSKTITDDLAPCTEPPVVTLGGGEVKVTIGDKVDFGVRFHPRQQKVAMHKKLNNPVLLQQTVEVKLYVNKEHLLNDGVAVGVNCQKSICIEPKSGALFRCVLCRKRASN